MNNLAPVWVTPFVVDHMPGAFPAAVRGSAEWRFAACASASVRGLHASSWQPWRAP